MKELKEYLNDCEHTLKSTVWVDNGSNEGYYGISLSQDDYSQKLKMTSSTGKKVDKRHVGTNDLLSTWESILNASVNEKISAAKMSRCVKNNTVIKDYYYCLST